MLVRSLSRWGACVLATAGGTGCSTYQYAQNVKLLAYDDANLSRGKSAGPIRGSDCGWAVLGNPIGDPPSLDRAIVNARTQSAHRAGTRAAKSDDRSAALRYINGASTKWDGFEAIVVSKRCLVVAGAGFR